MKTALIIIFLVISVILAVIVMMQEGKGGFHQNRCYRQDIGVHLDTKRVDAVNEAAEKTGCNKNRNDGNKNVAQDAR